MSVIIQMTEAEEAKALPILMRHSLGTVLSQRTYVVSEEAVKRLRAAGIVVRELSERGDGLKRCAGAMADEWTEEDDRILAEIHESRKQDGRRDVAP